MLTKLISLLSYFPNNFLISLCNTLRPKRCSVRDIASWKERKSVFRLQRESGPRGQKLIYFYLFEGLSLFSAKKILCRGSVLEKLGSSRGKMTDAFMARIPAFIEEIASPDLTSYVLYRIVYSRPLE